MTTSPPPPASALPPASKPQPPPPAPPPLLLTIRFSASLPDLELDIPRPGSTTVVSLKHLIRGRLGAPNATRRLRFIHGGKILPDSAVLSSVLRAPPLPPPPPTSHNNFPSARAPYSSGGDRNSSSHDPSSKGQGKAKGKSVPGRPDPAAAPRIYVNCSIGDELAPSELEAEAVAAAAPAPLFPSSHHHHHQHQSSPGTGAGSPSTAAPQPQAPRGFDRLLSAGFTASEVNQLRLQFRSIHSSRYTPDALPSPDGFRRMEDAWIDGNGSSIPSSGGGAGGGAFGGLGRGAEGGGGGGGGLGTDSDEEVGLVATVDVLIRGVVTGFVWPLGSAGWLIREEGMASGRWRFMVGVGVLFSLLLGMIRAISGDK